MPPYDDWKANAPEEDYITTKDVDQLQTVRERLKLAADALTRAKRGAVLSRGRESRISSAETELYDIMADIDEELSQC